MDLGRPVGQLVGERQLLLEHGPDGTSRPRTLREQGNSTGG